MNSLERVIRSIKHQPSDRCPVALHNFQVCARQSGWEFDRFFQNGDKMAEAQIEAWRKFGHDVILLENGTAALAEALGCGVVYRKNDPPAVTRPLLENLNEVDRLKLKSVADCPILIENLSATRTVSKFLGDRVFVMGRGDQGPFSLAALLVGIDQLLVEIALRENIPQIHKLLDLCTEFITRYAKEQIRNGAHCTSIGDSTAGPDVVSPEIYAEFALPYEKRIVSEVHAAGGLFSLHICGNATKILERMVETGVDVLEIDEKTDISLARVAAEGKVVLLGQISPLLLRNGSAEEVAQAARNTLQIMKGGSGLILGAGCAIASDTPEENLHVMVSASSKWGMG